MEVDRRAFLASLGSVAVLDRMDPEAKAEALEHYMMEKLDADMGGEQVAAAPPEATIRRGAGSLFGQQGPTGHRKMAQLAPMPAAPTLVDFFNLRFAPANHVLQ